MKITVSIIAGAIFSMIANHISTTATIGANIQMVIIIVAGAAVAIAAGADASGTTAAITIMGRW